MAEHAVSEHEKAEFFRRRFGASTRADGLFEEHRTFHAEGLSLGGVPVGSKPGLTIEEAWARVEALERGAAELLPSAVF